MTIRSAGFKNRRCATRSVMLVLPLVSLVPLLSLGVGVGQSALIGAMDYSDTYTIGTTTRPGTSHHQPGLLSDPYYQIESGTPPTQWNEKNFSFNVPGSGTVPEYPGNTGNAGAATGLAQTGGGDFNISYGLRDVYVVQFDACFYGTDRIDVGSYPSHGASIFTAPSLTVFFRNSGVIALYNGSAETATGFTTGVPPAAWHNYAVVFDRTGKTVAFYVDEVWKGALDLTTFAGGSYATFSNAAVGMGAGGYVAWFDNFQVGAPVNSDAFLVDAHRTAPLSVDTAGVIGTLSSAGRFVKGGEGTLTVTNNHLGKGSLVLESGSVELGADIGDLPMALRSGLAFWVDANRNVDAPGGSVTTWYDVRETSGGTTYPRARQYGGDPVPLLAQGGADVSGRMLVDFGSYGGGKWLQWQDASGNRHVVPDIRSVFLVTACPNGYGFLLGDWDSTNALPNSGLAHFHAGGNTGAGNPAGAALMNASWWNGSEAAWCVVNSQTFINGDFVRGNEQLVSATGEVMSLVTLANTSASNFGNDRNFKVSDGVPGVGINRQGGGRIGEALIYTAALTESQRRQVEAYLMKKWLGRNAGAVHVAEGAGLRFRGGQTNDLSLVTFSGLGSVTVGGAGHLILPSGSEHALPPITLQSGASVDSGTLVQSADQPFALEGGARYDVSDGVSARFDVGDSTMIEKTGDGTLAASSIAPDVRRVAVRAGALRIGPPRQTMPDALTNALDNASFEQFTPDAPAVDYTWGYMPADTGWTMSGDMSSGNAAEWSSVGVAFPAMNVPWCAQQPAPDGNCVVFLKRAGTIERSFIVPSDGRYEIAFYAAARPAFDGHLFQVLVDTINLIASVRTIRTGFSRIVCNTPVLEAGAHTLCFKGVYGDTDRASAIDAITVTPISAADYVMIPNAGFEYPTALAESVPENRALFEYNPPDAAWTFVGDPAVTNSGITEGNGPWYYNDMADGGHAAFLRQTGQLSTLITFPTTGVYRLSFRAAARVAQMYGVFLQQCSWYNGHDFNVTLNGLAVGRITTWKGGFESHMLVLPPVKDGDPLTQTLAFTGVNSIGGDRASLIDDVRVCRMPDLSNPGFETTNTLAGGTWEAGLAGAGWEFCAGADTKDQSGIARSGSAWGNAVVDGACCAFLQMRATIRQTVSFSKAGTYTLSFLAAGRGNYLDHDFAILFNNSKIGYVRTADRGFRRYSFRLPRVAANAPYLLSFVGLNHGDEADRASFLDSVQIIATTEPVFTPADIPKFYLALDADAQLELDYDGEVTLEGVMYNGQAYSGLMTENNTPFIRGTGTIYVTPRGMLFSVQ